LVVNEATGKRVSHATRERVIKAIQELKYNPNLTAKRLASGKMHAIGLYTPFKIPIFRNFTFLEMLTGIQDVLSPSGFDLVLFSGGRNLYKHRPIQQIVRENTVDGLIIFNTRYTNQRYVKSYIDVLNDLNFNFVVVHYYWGRAPINYVGVDYKKATLQGMQHLLSLGHKKVAMLGGNYRAPVTAKILKAYKKALHKFDITFDENLVVYADYDYSQAYKKTKSLLGQHHGITAFFIAGFEMAPACLKAVREKGYKVPQEVSILCYVDDQIIPLLDPPLTAIQWPYYNMGKRAAQLLIDENLEKQTETFDTELIVRGSTAGIGENR
jgi:DNA-binding LacI/PurR family transcriptional regulator